MIETFLFGVVLYAGSKHYKEAIESIICDINFFNKNMKLVIIDAQKNKAGSAFMESLVEVYPGNVVYLKSEPGNRIEAYNQGIPHCKAKYIHFTTSDVIYREGTFQAIKAYSENNKVDVFAIHTKYTNDINRIVQVEDYKESQWDFTENLCYLPLYLNRYFIKYTVVKETRFHEEFHEDALKQFLIPCFAKQEQITIVAKTLMYYSESQERNLTSYIGKQQKWWYIPQIRDMLIPMLEEYKAQGPIPEQIQNLVYYMIRIKFYHNMNGRYDYGLNYEEVKAFLKWTSQALQYIDDHIIKNVKNIVVTPKFMNYYFLKLKYGEKDYCPEIAKDADGKLAFVIQGEVFAAMEDMVVSLQHFSIDKETKERLVEVDWFYNYLVENSQCETQIEVNGKPAKIEYNDKDSHEHCFGKMVRRKYKFTIRIPKEERKLWNTLRFYVIIRGERYEIKGKYARRKMLARLKTRIQQGRLARFFQKVTKSKFVVLYKLAQCFCKQKPNKVVMLSDSRSTLSGNLEFVDRELKKEGFQVEYFFKKSLKEKKTLRECIRLCSLMASSKYIVLDDFYPIVYPIKLGKNTELIQVWHAMGAFKTVGFSRLGKIGGPSPTSLSHRNYTAAITSAEGIRHNYAEAFWIDIDKVHATGVPRTDIFFDETYIQTTKDRIYNNYPMLKEKKVVLFAPTFRGTGQKSAYYNFEWLDFQAIEEALGDEYVFIVKLHPFIKNTENVPVDNDVFLDMTAEREINDLLFVTDILITDYSSVIFEASLLDIDTIFYVPDLEEYTADRDFYYPFETYTYGTIAKNMDELICGIQHPTNDSEKLKAFKEHFCGACDGHATERFVATLFTKEDTNS